MSIKNAKVIDIHAHAVLPEVMGAAGKYGPEISAEADGTPIFRIGDYILRGVRYSGSAFMDPDIRIAAMDKAGIDFQLLSPNPLTYFHFIPAQEAVNFCQIHNDAMAELVNLYPERLAGMATLPMQNIDAAITELYRSVRELRLKGAYIGTDFPGGLDAPEMETFYQAVTDLDIPLFLHPAPAGVNNAGGKQLVTKYELDIMVGFTAQETMAVASLIFGGVLHRHPRLDICISHGGGALALIHGRLKHASQKRPWAEEFLQGPDAFDTFAARLWYDIHMHDDRALDLLVERVGTDRLVYGTNFAGWDAPEKFEAPRCDAALADNARRLLRL